MIIIVLTHYNVVWFLNSSFIIYLVQEASQLLILMEYYAMLDNTRKPVLEVAPTTLQLVLLVYSLLSGVLANQH